MGCSNTALTGICFLHPSPLLPHHSVQNWLSRAEGSTVSELRHRRDWQDFQEDPILEKGLYMDSNSL